jgi:hypothetical protein
LEIQKTKLRFPLIGIYRPSRKDLAVLFAGLILFLGFLRGCPDNTLSKKEIKEMKAQYLLEYGKPPALWPITVGLKEECDIFSVPEENAVATNSLNNAITLLRFDKDKVGYDELRKEFIDGVGSGDKFYPGIFSDQWTGYTQTRGFLLFNLKDRSFADHIIIKPSYEWITNVGTINGDKKEFLFQVCRADEKRFLRIMEFDGKGGFKQISELQAGPHPVGYIEPWAIQNETIFVYNNESIKITTYDINFKPVPHPFCELFNSMKNFRCLGELAIHPSLPFALLVENDTNENRVWLARWNHPDKDKRLIELIGQKISVLSGMPPKKDFLCSKFQFSPDGKWLVFRDNSESSDNPLFVAMPIDGTQEMPLGKPHILGKVMRENGRPKSTAWITKPLSFVVCDGQVLYKWELEGLIKK